MENSFRYFKNNGCKYFPCHTGLETDDFNCLFCFCPLYFLSDKCGGAFMYNKKGVKSCENCRLPHLPDYYDVIIETLEDYSSKGRLK